MRYFKRNPKHVGNPELHNIFRLKATGSVRRRCQFRRLSNINVWVSGKVNIFDPDKYYEISAEEAFLELL